MAKPRESVWDYPRPPAVVPTEEHVHIRHRGHTIVDTHAALRVLETSHPPTYYVPKGDVDLSVIEEVSGHTWCEFKGQASYGDLVIGEQRVVRALWWYPKPQPAYLALTGYLAFYPGKVDECTVDGELVVAQEGDFYGGWVTSRVTGPFKGGPGTWGW